MDYRINGVFCKEDILTKIHKLIFKSFLSALK